MMAESWRLTGKVLVACNCDWGCPCNFNARPTTGKCEGGWTWHVEEGSFHPNLSRELHPSPSSGLRLDVSPAAGSAND